MRLIINIEAVSEGDYGNVNTDDLEEVIAHHLDTNGHDHGSVIVTIENDRD